MSFQGNLYFPLPLPAAADLFTNFDRAVENGFFSNLSNPGDNRLFCFHEEKDAVEVGRAMLAEQAVSVPGAQKDAPVFAVVHIGPIAPMGLPSHVQVDTEICQKKALILEAAGVARIAQIVRTGSFAYNRVDMSIKLFTL